MTAKVVAINPLPGIATRTKIKIQKQIKSKIVKAILKMM